MISHTQKYGWKHQFTLLKTNYDTPYNTGEKKKLHSNKGFQKQVHVSTVCVTRLDHEVINRYLVRNDQLVKRLIVTGILIYSIWISFETKQEFYEKGGW